MVLGSVGRGYCKKKQGVRIFGQNFWLGCLSAFNELRNAGIRKKFLEMKIELIGIGENILNVNNQQRGKGFKKLIAKQMLQRLLIALAQVKSVNTFENLLSESRQIIYSLYQAKEITKIVHNNLMNSIKL